MGFLDIFGKREKREKRALDEASTDLLRALIGNDDISAEKALEIPAFSQAVDFISSTVAMLPVKLYREDKTAHKTEEITDDRRLFLLNDEADPLMGAGSCRKAQIRDMLLYGSGFIFINQNNFGEITSLNYVKKSDVSVVTNAHPIFRDFNIYVGGRGYLPWNFVILTRNSPDGVTGKGAVEEHKTLLSAMYLTMKYEAVISRTGGNKKGFLQSERALSDEAMAKLKSEWNDLYANNENNIMILNSGIKYAPSASTSVEMQLNENKRTNSEQIALVFGLSPAVISGNCTTAEYMSAVRTAVLPVVEQVQEALNRSLLTEAEKGEYYFVLDTAELLKGDTLSRYQAYEIALRNNFLQLDEVRYLEDKAPLGFDFMRLGLNDVLYDIKTKTVYTPNMNAFQQLNGNAHLTNDSERGIMELRKKSNWVKGAKGRFAGSVPLNKGSLGLTKDIECDIMNLGSDDVALEYQRYGRNKGTLINKSYIESGEYKRKFDNATDIPELNKSLYDAAKIALKHRNGTEFEDMYWFDGKTGKIIACETNSSDYRCVKYSVATKKAVNSNNDVVVLHTHPSSMPPSIEDFNSCYLNSYKAGFIACHNGKIYGYLSEQMISPKLYELSVCEYLQSGLSEFDAQMKTLENLKRNHRIDFWEVQ